LYSRGAIPGEVSQIEKPSTPLVKGLIFPLEIINPGGKKNEKCTTTNVQYW